MATPLFTEPVTKDEMVLELERVLDSPYESDKWRSNVERLYIRLGGQNTKLVNPALREFMLPEDPIKVKMTRERKQ
jgi:hypothetical protein